MMNFASDYTEGCHPKILEALSKTNLEQTTGYGTDIYTESAKDKIRSIIGRKEADIFFLTGGTQTNQTVIDSMLKMYEGVVSVQTGHVNVHEAGAIEFTGHKVLALPAHEGKMDAEELDKYVAGFYADSDHEHMVFPGMVYISHPTEFGTLYTKTELKAISEVCGKWKLPLFLDGARLGYGLMSKDTDVTIKDIAELTDVFYIGGTKVGALCGEAVVFPKGNSPKHFVTMIKEHGALLAKGRLNGIQFDTLFTDDLYFNIAKNAIERAEELKKIFAERNYKFFMNSPTNQQFIIMENSKLLKLDEEEVIYSRWEPYDEAHMVVRFCTSWATTTEQIEKLAEVLDRL
ncbi:MAG: low specificity L-threonine aldolase [Lachnospiraceae bacterium]|nr:low specificity L-threonine aldolase [Lachnospiraceae bacterium]